MRKQILAGIALLAIAMAAQAFDSGSTGADGELAPNVNTEIVLPPSGVLNYTSITIPAGVRVTFRPNALNTPVMLRVSGDALVAGVLDVNGQNAADSSGAGDGNVADDGLPGKGGPGGFAGGRGGRGDPSIAVNSPRMAASGVGPGGGRPSTQAFNLSCYGTGGNFGAVPTNISFPNNCAQSVAPTYGNPDLLPLVGGSGGSGGHGGPGVGGAGGGGGGGAVLIAVSGTLNVTGQILANGGRGGRIGGDSNTTLGAVGGGGSGGGIRLIATTLAGNGAISAVGGQRGDYQGNGSFQPSGGLGRIRLEADARLRTSPTTPDFTSSLPGLLVVAGLPSIRISRVGGIDAPAAPTGTADVVLPTAAPNPVELVLATTNVPLGNTISIIVNPPAGVPQTVVSTAIVGTEASGTASANVDIPLGSSVLLATLSYSVSAAQAQQLSAYTGGEPVLTVELAAQLGAGSGVVTLVTASGRRVALPSAAL